MGNRLLLCAAAAAALLLAGRASAQPRVEVVTDLLTAFGSAHVHDALACELKRPATSGAVREPGLMEHPKTVGVDARLDYTLRRVTLDAGEMLVLAFDYGISDGAKLDDPQYKPDGVRFSVNVNGSVLFRQGCRESRWHPGAVDLTPFAGGDLAISFAVDPLGNCAYDWALWGRPRILRFRASPAGPGLLGEARVGAAALAIAPGHEARVRMAPVGPGSATEWQPVAAGPAPRWLVLDFSFPAAHAARVEVDPAESLEPGSARIAAYPPGPRLTLLSATSAVPVVGQRTSLRAVVCNDGPGLLAAGAASVVATADGRALPPRAVPTLLAGEAWRAEWPWAPTTPDTHPITARLTAAPPGRAMQRLVEVFPKPVPARVSAVQNRHVRLEFVREGNGYAYARVLERRAGGWRQVAVWQPLMRAVLAGQRGDVDWPIRPGRWAPGRSGRAADLVGNLVDPQGATWTVRLSVELDPDRPLARLSCRWSANRPRRLRSLWGPNVYVGDGTTGERKTWGLFPGLEYLYRGETSSSPRDFAPPLDDRRTPLPWKVTAPLMAITVGPDGEAPPERAARFWCPDSAKDAPASGLRDAPQSSLTTVALLWNQDQRWDGSASYPSARFASPNRDEGMANHRMALFLPSVPDYVAENADRAARPYVMPAGKSLRLEARLLVTPGPALGALREWYRQIGGIPRPRPWPRGYASELDLCRTGFLKTVWNDSTSKWRACIEFAEAYVPGIAALLWMDAHTAPDPTGRRLAAERVDRAARAMLADGGPALFGSRAACHIMRWEFPFLYGYLPEALAGIEPEIRQIVQGQAADGGWPFHASDPQHADLGAQGDCVVGLCAHNAWMLARYARVTGDKPALAAAERALSYMERFRVPRGAGPWECPIYEPDVLASSWTLPAYVEAWQATGNPRWLNDAVYWAETGLPFVYLWSLPGRPMMLGSTLPVFGSTFYTHSWLGMPVQWEGMVYAYHLRHLADALEHGRPKPGASPLLPIMGLTPADWRRLADLQTVSGMYQQVPDGERVGTYPDSISDFQKRNPVFINPENILVNVLAQRGQDPDIKTVRLRTAAGDVLVSSGAAIGEATSEDRRLRFRLRFFPGEASHTLVAGVTPAAVAVDGGALTRSEAPVRRAAGWWWDAATRRLYIVAPHHRESIAVEVSTR